MIRNLKNTFEARRNVIAAMAIVLLLLCNLFSVVLGKMVAERFSLEIRFPATLILLIFAGLWGSTYLIRLLLWLFVGKRFQLSFVYPILELNYFLTYLVDIVFWHEPFTWRQTGALSLICIGILVITMSRERYAVPAPVPGGGQ